MKVLFDFLHPVDINFFLNTVRHLKDQEKDEVFFIYRDRGAVSNILKYEFPDLVPVKIGKHVKGFINKVLTQFKRDVNIYRFIKKNDIEIALSFGPSIGLACKLLKIPFISFADDPEYKLTMWHAQLFADVLVMPNFNGLPQKVTKYKGFKELAYLHPNYFYPATSVLTQYDLSKYEYVFVRDVSNISLNYKNLNNNLLDAVKYLSKKGIKILLSLEDKKKIEFYNKYCIVLEEPVNNFHSLIYYSKFVLTSGDSLAREASLLGVPVIYTGGREMKANEVFINMGIMAKIDHVNSIKKKADLLLNQKNEYLRKNIQNKTQNEWDDITGFIIEIINKYRKHDNK